MNVRVWPWREIVALCVAALALVLFAAMRASKVRPEPSPLEAFSTYSHDSDGLAAYLELLRRERIAVTQFDGRPDDLDAKTTTLIAAISTQLLSPQTMRREADAFRRFVVRGGRLIVLGSDFDENVRKSLQLPKTTSYMSSQNVSASFIRSDLRAAGVSRVNLRVRNRLFPHGNSILLSDKFGALATSYHIGRGEVVAFIAAEAFSNASIAQGDHARLAYAIAVGGRPRAHIAFDERIHGRGVSGTWYELLPLSVRIGIVIALLALALAAWRAALRTGPPLAPPVVPAPGSIDYISSVAALYRRARAYDEGIDAATRAIVATVDRSRLDPNLAERYDGLRALASIDEPTPADLRRAVSIALALRKDTRAHARGLRPRA